MRFFLLITSLCWTVFLFGQKIIHTINLKSLNNDQLRIQTRIVFDHLTSDSVYFCFPSVVPGTYDKYDFGRFVSNLSITDYQNKPVLFKKINDNMYAFRATSECVIEYTVDDTWDHPSREKFVFEPAGTNFEENKNFILNNHAVFGFIYGKEHWPATVIVEKTEGFYPVTGLQNLRIGFEKDTLYAESYHHLADAPIMYCRPDTVRTRVDNMDVWIGCYSPRNKIKAGFIARTLRELLYAQRDYLGGKLPVDKYAFIFYFTDKFTRSGSTGALEHNNSSLYVLFEADSEQVKQTLRDVCAHEFFHIVTPLTLHSEEIGNFNYISPEMSRHLWLYEGLTEYSAHHAQLRAGIITLDDFLNIMIQKRTNSLKSYDDRMSFTEMSQKILLPKYNKQYANVYEKGALINLCLDLTLLHLTEGKYGLRQLMRDLEKKYGKNKNFRDEELFDEISTLSHPDIREFFKKYVEGSEPLPFSECLRYAGIVFHDSEYVKSFTLGSFEFSYNYITGRFYVDSDEKDLDAFGKALGIRKYDELVALNGNGFRASTDDVEMIQNFYKNLKEGDMVELEVMRPKNKRRKKFTPITLKAPAFRVDVLQYNTLSLDENFNESQKKVLSAWSGITFR